MQESAILCLLLITLFAGPRAGIFLWWVIDPDRWDRAFDTWVWPVLGFFFLPWTTIMFVLVAPTGNPESWDWFWLSIAFFGDILQYAGSGYSNRERIPGY